MPEIKNTSNAQTNPENERFTLPKRKYTAWHFVVPVLLVIALAGGWFAHALIPNAAAPEAAMVPKGEGNDQTSATISGYYLATKGSDSPTSLYSYSSDTSVLDKKLFDVGKDSPYIIGKYIDSDSYVLGNNQTKLFLFNIATQKTENLLDLPAKSISGKVSISSDKKWLAYPVNYETDDGKGLAEIWLYNIETKEQKNLVKKTPLGLYQGFSVLGWHGNDTQLVVGNIGGDAGAIWGDVSTVDVATGELEKFSPTVEKDIPGFLQGQLSPSGNEWLYKYCEKFDTTAIEKAASIDMSDACLTGAELRLYNISTKKTTVAYHNERYNDNAADKSVLQTIKSFKWQDDQTIIVVVPAAIISVTKNDPKSTTELYVYNAGSIDDLKNFGIYLQSVTKDLIVFTANNTWSVFDRQSKKITDLNPSSQSLQIQSWLD